MLIEMRVQKVHLKCDHLNLLSFQLCVCVCVRVRRYAFLIPVQRSREDASTAVTAAVTKSF